MLHRGIGAAIGALVTLILLLVIGPSGATVDQYIPALVVGAVVTFAWPILAVWWLARRSKARQQSKIEDEVQRQLNQQ